MCTGDELTTLVSLVCISCKQKTQDDWRDAWIQLTASAGRMSSLMATERRQRGKMDRFKKFRDVPKSALGIRLEDKSDKA